MAKWPPRVWQYLIVGGTVLGLLAIAGLKWTLSVQLPQWVHVPLATLTKVLIAVGGGLAGVAVLEYRARAARQGGGG